MSDKLRDAADYAIRRLQSDIDSGSRPDQWSMEDIVRGLRAALAGGDAVRGTMREAFEAWAREYGRIFLNRLPQPMGLACGEVYENQFTQEAWVGFQAGWQAATRAAALPCGHPTSLMLHSAETGEPLYCELCDDKSGRADAADLDDMLIMRFLNPRSEGETLRQCINRIIDWDVMVNLDPAVSSAAQALVDQGRKRPEAEVADWRIEYDNDAGPDGGFHEWWDVTDGERTFRCDAKDEAEWLLERLVRGEKP